MVDKKNRIGFVTNAPNGDRIAAFELSGATQVWNVHENKRVSRFNTIFERGVQRIAMNSDGKLLAVGSYKENGVSLYDTNTGQEIWNRTDLNRVLKVRFSPLDNVVMTVFNIDQAAILDSKTGRSRSVSWFKKLMSGVQDIYESPFNSILVREQLDNDLLITTKKHIELNSIPQKSFGILDHAFSMNQLCITESGGPVTCYDILTGAELWEFDPGDDSHGLSVSFVSNLEAYATIVWNYENGGDHTTYLLDRISGDCINKFVVPDRFPACINDGNQMLFTDGSVINTANGKLQRRIEFMSGLAG